MNLRPYQTAAVEAAIRTSQHARALVVLPTGTGKTVVMTEIVRRMATSKPALLLVHTDEIALQAERTLRAVGCRVQVEKAERRAYLRQRDMWGGPSVVIGSVQTLQGKRLQRWRPDSFGVVLIDEAHHAIAPTWMNVLAHFRDAPQIGVTATAQRKGLGDAFQLSYEMGLLEAIDKGWLVPPRFRVVVNRQWRLRKLRRVAADVTDGQLERALGPGAFAECMRLLQNELGGTARGILFAPSRGVARSSAEWMDAAGITSTYIEGKTPTDARRGAVTRFRGGVLRLLSNCQVLTEGFDCPDADRILLMRPTMRVGFYQQMIGRGLRPMAGLVDRYDRAEDRRAAIAESHKPECRILDIQGVAGRLAEKLVSPLMLVGGEWPPPRLDKKPPAKGEDEAVVQELEDVSIEDLKALVAEHKAQVERERVLSQMAERQREMAEAQAPIVEEIEVLSGRQKPATEAQVALVVRLCRSARLPSVKVQEYERRARTMSMGAVGGMIHGLKRKAGWK